MHGLSHQYWSGLKIFYTFHDKSLMSKRHIVGELFHHVQKHSEELAFLSLALLLLLARE